MSMKKGVDEAVDIYLTDMLPEESEAVVELLVAAMNTNPINQAVFKSRESSRLRRQRKMFEYVVSSKHNRIRLAKTRGKIIGVMCSCTSHHCQLSLGQILATLPSLMLAMKGDIFRLLEWRMKWGEHDHKQPHVHLGPIAVDPAFQGKGVGSYMLTEICGDLDDNFLKGYLETDKRENLSFYERFGFEVVKTDEVLGVTNWFMLRR